MRIAALDVGSNSLHLLVVAARPDGTFEPLLREKEMLRLGDVVSREGCLTDSSIESLVSAVGRFATLATAAGVSSAADIVACGTAALREADNSAAVVDRIEAATGVRVDVIAGAEEARLVFAAVRASVILEPSPALCLDLGGGSLELTLGDAAGMQWARSVKLGVARLTAELVRSDPPSGGDQGRLRRRIDGVLGPLAAEIGATTPRMLVGTSGTLCDLARMAASRSGAVPASVNQLTVSRADLDAVHADIVQRPLETRRRLPGLDSRRADLAPAGSMVLQSAMDLFGFEAMTVSDWALREGMVLDAIGRHDAAELADDQSGIRRSSVLGLCRRCTIDARHGRQVARLATDLFDRTRALHGLGPEERELLEYGALLHDAGEHISSEGHHKHTAYLIEHGRLRGFSPEEVSILASLGRFHRRGDPKASFPMFGGLPAPRRNDVTILVALLRLADGLDCGHASVVTGVDVELAAGSVVLHVRSDADADLALWGLRRKRDLFQRLFGYEVRAVAGDWCDEPGAPEPEPSEGSPDGRSASRTDP